LQAKVEPDSEELKEKLAGVEVVGEVGWAVIEVCVAFRLVEARTIHRPVTMAGVASCFQRRRWRAPRIVTPRARLA
jgi:hypothetical protein